MMVLNREEGLECGISIDGMDLEHVSEFKYLPYVLDESGTDEAECRRKSARERRVGCAIRSLVNARGLQLQCARILHVKQ